MNDCAEHNINGTRVLDSGSGFPMVFVHGFTTTAEFWRHQAAEFSSSYRIVRIELRGHGRADRQPGESYTIDAYAADVTRVISELKLSRFLLIGLSMGGTIAQAVALDKPAGLSGLVLVGGTAHGLGPDVHAERVIAQIQRVGMEQSAQDVIDASFSASASPELVAWARSEVIQTPAFVATEAIRSLNDADHRDALDQLDVPTLVVVGEEDDITPVKESELLARLIPGAELAVIANAAHFPMLEQPAAFNDVFLQFVHGIQCLRV